MKLRNRFPVLAAFLAALVLGSAATAPAVGLRLGTARVEITPPVGYAMQGYENRKGVSTGVHDPLWARVLVVKSDETSLAFVSLDLVDFASQAVVDGARQHYAIEHVLLSSSHTHSGPRTMLWGDGGPPREDRTWPSPDHSWYAATEQKLLAAIGEASRQLEPVSLVPAMTFAELGYNRRKVDDDGAVKMLWQNPERKPSHPLDARVGLLVFKDAQNRARAVIVNFACHAVILGPDNLQVSADYPGVMSDYVEKQLGAGALCLFVQGAAGDINPFEATTRVKDEAFDLVRKTGLELGEKVVAAVRQTKNQKGGEGKIQVQHDALEFPNRWKPAEKVRAGMDTILFDRSLAIATLPGEPFVDLQIALAEQSEVEYTFLFGYTVTGDGGWVGYIPTLEAAAQGGYGAGYGTFIGVGAGEAMVDRAVINLYQMTGHDFRQMLDVLVEEVQKSH